MTKLVYTKDSGEVSTRDVEPIGFTFDDRDKVLCIDFNGLEAEDREILQGIKRNYLETLYKAGFAKNIRSFFLENIEVIG